jgi:hypothetical protein
VYLHGRELFGHGRERRIHLQLAAACDRDSGRNGTIAQATHFDHRFALRDPDEPKRAGFIAGRSQGRPPDGDLSITHDAAYRIVHHPSHSSDELRRGKAGDESEKQDQLYASEKSHQ